MPLFLNLKEIAEKRGYEYLNAKECRRIMRSNNPRQVVSKVAHDCWTGLLSEYNDFSDGANQSMWAMKVLFHVKKGVEKRLNVYTKGKFIL